ncbi:MAG TPA: TIGR03435 family protein [Bryobacteraceae bacterium]|nr:TIGR03435 family protein [Bryobacteraceae bacterium]
MTCRNKLAAVILLTVLPAFSQMAFDAASVRPVRDDTRTWAIRQVTTTRYRSLSNVMQLITWAWNVKNYQILNAPSWTSEDRFEIQATTANPSSTADQREMLQSLLKERFGLKVHHETREIPVYALVVGKNGMKLAVAKENPEPGHRGINIESGMLIARSGTLDNFADILTTNMDRPVLNRTNLNGSYDFTLTWEPPNGKDGPWAPFGPALLSTIRELGLRLDPAKAPIDMLVIEAIERPSER